MPSMYAYASAEPLTPPAATARHVALDLIGAVLRRKRPLDEAIEDMPGDAPAVGARPRLRPAAGRDGVAPARPDRCADRACLNTPLPPRAAMVHDILRLGIAQLLFLRTPPHAAVATSVDLAQSRGLSLA